MNKYIVPSILSLLFITILAMVVLHYPPLENIDQMISNKISAIQDPLSTSVFKAITNIGGSLSAIIIGGVILTVLFLKRRRVDIAIVVVTMFLDLGLVELIKHLIERGRPISSVLQETGWSFPSGHASFAGLMMILISSLFISQYKNTGRVVMQTLIIVIALGIAYSRIYLEVHWVSDVVAGMLLGISIALFTINVLRKLSSGSQKTIEEQTR